MRLNVGAQCASCIQEACSPGQSAVLIGTCLYFTHPLVSHCFHFAVMQKTSKSAPITLSARGRGGGGGSRPALGHHYLQEPEPVGLAAQLGAGGGGGGEPQRDLGQPADWLGSLHSGSLLTRAVSHAHWNLSVSITHPLVSHCSHFAVMQKTSNSAPITLSATGKGGGGGGQQACSWTSLPSRAGGACPAEVGGAAERGGGGAGGRGKPQKHCEQVWPQLWPSKRKF